MAITGLPERSGFDKIGRNLPTRKELVSMANPVVTITMENGDVMKAELYPEIAPNTVRNFISLIKKGFYDGLIFHRVISGFMIQGGCPDGVGTGVLSMARSMAPDSAGSQFFIMHKKSPHLDGAYAAFGKIVEGMDVVDKIADVRTDYMDRPMEEQKIQSMTVDTKETEYPEPETC